MIIGYSRLLHCCDSVLSNNKLDFHCQVQEVILDLVNIFALCNYYLASCLVQLEDLKYEATGEFKGMWFVTQIIYALFCRSCIHRCWTESVGGKVLCEFFLYLNFHLNWSCHIMNIEITQTNKILDQFWKMKTVCLYCFSVADTDWSPKEVCDQDQAWGLIYWGTKIGDE